MSLERLVNKEKSKKIIKEAISLGSYTLCAYLTVLVSSRAYEYLFSMQDETEPAEILGLAGIAGLSSYIIVKVANALDQSYEKKQRRNLASALKSSVRLFNIDDLIKCHDPVKEYPELIGSFEIGQILFDRYTETGNEEDLKKLNEWTWAKINKELEEEKKRKHNKI